MNNVKMLSDTRGTVDAAIRALEQAGGSPTQEQVKQLRRAWGKLRAFEDTGNQTSEEFRTAEDANSNRFGPSPHVRLNDGQEVPAYEVNDSKSPYPNTIQHGKVVPTPIVNK